MRTADGETRQVGRYLLFGELAAGGMATVHLGRLIGPVGFARTVAIKRLHAQFAKDPEFVSMFLDEARLAARIRHPNVVPVLDIVAAKGELFLVMDFVVGVALSQLVRTAAIVSRTGGTGAPARMAVSLMVGVLQGVHAAHETRGERDEPLNIVHRDISPQNILVGHDGVARLIDFGIAKAMGRLHASQSGQLKGKLPYMAPEQLRGEVGRGSDIFSTGVVLWELLSGHRLFAGDTEGETYARVHDTVVRPPSELLSGTAQEQARFLDPVILRALRRNPDERYATAKDFALALEEAIPPASVLAVGAWVEQVAGPAIEARLERIREVEEVTTGSEHLTVESFTKAISKSETEPLEDLELSSSPRTLVRLPQTSTGSIEVQTEFALATAAGPAPTPVVPARSRLRPMALGLAGLAVLGAGFAMFLGNDAGTARAVTSRISAVPPAVAILPSASSTSPEPALAPSAAVVAGSPTSSQRPGRAAKPPSTIKPPAATKPKGDCNPPFTLDDHGNKHFKPECFH